MVEKSDKRGDVKLFGRTRLKWEEAIERALEGADQPLDANQIAKIFSQNNWLKQLPANLTDAVGAAITRVIARGNKPGIVVILGGGRKRSFWLNRKGPVPASAQLARDIEAVRNRAARASQQLDQTLAQCRDTLAKARDVLANVQNEKTG